MFNLCGNKGTSKIFISFVFFNMHEFIVEVATITIQSVFGVFELILLPTGQHIVGYGNSPLFAFE